MGPVFPNSGITWSGGQELRVCDILAKAKEIPHLKGLDWERCLIEVTNENSDKQEGARPHMTMWNDFHGKLTPFTHINPEKKSTFLYNSRPVSFLLETLILQPCVLILAEASKALKNPPFP